MNESRNPLALTDEELGRIYKAISATGLRGGVRAERRTPQPGEKGKGKSPLLFRVVAPANRTNGERTVAHAETALDADVIVHAFNHLAFLIESFQSVRHELECVEASLDAHQVPKELPTGEPYSLHGRVLKAMNK